MRITDIYPNELVAELVRLYRLDKNWILLRHNKDESYGVECRHQTWLKGAIANSAGALAMWAASHWLGGGPKLFRPSKDQCKAMEQIAVNLTLEEFSMPYPALMVELDYPPFNSCLVFKTKDIMICSLHSADHVDDICTTIAVNKPDHEVEKSLQKFDDDCKELAPQAALALRVACNCCLALTHYGNHLSYLFPKEVARDVKLASEKSERGKRAVDRIQTAVMLVSFKQEIVLHDTAKERVVGDPIHTGREMPSHWRKGHWANQPYGPNNSLRRRILRKPTLVRADLFVGDLSDTTAIYKG